MSAATSGTLNPCSTVSTSRTVRPPGSRCDTPGANAGSKASRSIETYTGSRSVGRRPAHRADRLLDFRPRIGGRGAEGQVARVAEGTVRAQIDARLRPGIAGRGMQRLADQRGRSRRALEKGGARVVGEAEQSRGAANRTGHGQKEVGKGGRYMRPEPLLPANAPPSRVDGRRQRAVWTCQTPYPSPLRSRLRY